MVLKRVAEQIDLHLWRTAERALFYGGGVTKNRSDVIAQKCSRHAFVVRVFDDKKLINYFTI